MVTNSNFLTVFLGDAPDPSEQHVLERLRDDLREVPTLVVANFFPEGARRQRQIDFLIRTPHRTVHVELKTLNQQSPISTTRNGNWTQHLTGGDREIGNPFRQAQDGTYAISDSMRAFAGHASGVPTVDYKRFETVVCVYPDIPPGSKVARYAHVDFVGYDELLRRLNTPGRQLPWTPEQWENYLRYLSVYRERDESSEAQALRDAVDDVSDYRARFRAQQDSALHELVTLPATVNGDDAVPIEAIEAVAEGNTVTLVGESGLGKSHTALHASRRLTDRGCTVIWARVGEYDEGKLAALLGRSVAPYTIDTALDLVSKTDQTGGQVVVVVDGFTGAVSEDRLLEQLAAFRLRHRIGLLLTSIVPRLLGSLGGILVELAAPDITGRAALLASYGIRATTPVVQAFVTPFEIATLAAITTELPAETSAALVHSAYIDELTGSETVRAGLSVLAFAMAAELRSALRRVESRTLLHRTGGLSANDIDAILTNPLLEVTQGHVQFRHELHGKFLAAEHLVHVAPTGGDLGRHLTPARYQDLRAEAIGLEHDPARVSEALTVLADPDLYAAAAAGELGPVAATQTRGEIVSTLVEAACHTDATTNTFTDDPNEPSPLFGGAWQLTRPCTARETALLSAAGIRVWSGDFVDEIGTLLDRTDLVCHAAMRELQELGHQQAISCVVATTYSGVTSPTTEPLPATIVTQSCHDHAWRLRHDRRPAIAGKLAEGASQYSWGRLSLALEVFNAETDTNQLVHLVRSAWDAGGYHLQLQALHTATLAVRPLDDATRAELADLVETFDANHNIWLSTTLIELLSAAGRIQSDTTIADIDAEITATIAQPDDPNHRATAARIYGDQFEDDIIGPYAEAIDSLDPADRLTLLIMAASTYSSPWLPSILSELVDHLPSEDPRLVDVFRRHATRFPADRFIINIAIDTYLFAVRGWARVADAIPTDERERNADDLAWHLVAELILHHERSGNSAHDPAHTWQRLLDECPQATIDVLRWCSTHHRYGDVPDYVAVLHDTYPTEFMQLIECGFTHQRELTSLLTQDSHQTNTEFLFLTLGRYGTADTIGLLRPYAEDPILGSAAVAAIRQLQRREQPTP